MGEKVGYSIRFEDVTSAATRIKFVTDGLLLREALVDPLLSRYSIIMVDEAHERSLSTDILLGILRKIMKKRPELHIVISSATLEAERFLDFFEQSNTETPRAKSAEALGRIVGLEGRAYPVDTFYLEEPCEDYLDRAIATALDIHASEPTGDILIFLTGREEIETVLQKIADRIMDKPDAASSLSVVPMYAGLPMESQMAVFEAASDGVRKIVVATNIAEASVTIDGIVYVIDSGFVKLRAFNPITGIDALVVTPISQAAAAQRAGRAGRTKPGKCFRLFTEESFRTLDAATPPEIQRSNLAPTILQLKALGIDNVMQFGFLTPPPAELVARALELLYALGALDDYAKLTRPLGHRMAELALEPMLAKSLLDAPKFGCLNELLSIAAMTSTPGSVWASQSEKSAGEITRRVFAAEESDHLTLLNVYHAFVSKGRRDAAWCKKSHLNFKFLTQAARVRNQIARYLERFGMDLTGVEGNKARVENAVEKTEKVQRCLTAGYFANAARMQSDGSFKTVNGGTTLHAHPSSLLFVSLIQDRPNGQ